MVVVLISGGINGFRMLGYYIGMCIRLICYPLRGVHVAVMAMEDGEWGMGPSTSIAEDVVGWNGSCGYQFALREAYMAQARLPFGPHNIVWSTIQKFWGIQHIKVFMWLACCGKLMTNATQRSFIADNNCPLCRRAPEDVNHLLRLCPSVLVVWMSLIKTDQFEEFCAMDLHEWVRYNLKNSGYFARE
ncbi:hypothetical protein V6N13_101067 [Hibiscus sabdariffa]